MSRTCSQRITSCKSKNAGAWLTAVPTIPELYLTDVEFRYAARHRLGLVPAQDLQRCACGQKLADAPWHFQCCAKLKPRAITHRHNMLVQLLASFFRQSGAMVQVEKKPVGADRSRPDLDIVTHNQRLFVDVAVVHPATLARRSHAALAAARDIEQRKAHKYRELVAAHNASFLAFVVESYGAFGAQAMKVLQVIGNGLARGHSASNLDWKQMVEMLSISIQRGNATISAEGSLAARDVRKQ